MLLNSSVNIKDPYGFIYITTNLINGKKYIGQKSFDGASRWQSYKGSGSYLINAFSKYGKENFVRDIVDIGYSLEEMNAKEKEWIQTHNAVESDDFYNLIDGGTVVDWWVEKNSIPVICLNNNMTFATMREASYWSGHTSQTIRLRFDENLVYKNRLVFRELTLKCRECEKPCIPRTDIRKGLIRCFDCVQHKGAYCPDCDRYFMKKSNNQQRCKKCAIKRNRDQARERMQKRRALKKSGKEE